MIRPYQPKADGTGMVSWEPAAPIGVSPSGQRRSMQNEAVLESPSTVLVRSRRSGLGNQKRSRLLIVS